MTDFELLTLFYQVIDVANAALANYLTIIIAMLVASYLVASKLDRTSTALVTVLFTVFCLGMTNEIRGSYSDFASIAALIAEQSLVPGSTLGWHPAAQGAPFQFIPVVITTVCLLAYLGTMWFFFHGRMKSTVTPEGEAESA